MNADHGFNLKVDRLFGMFNSVQIFNILFRFVISIPLAFYLFGMLYANASKDNAVKTGSPDRFRFIAPTVAYSAITPICLLYVLFFITQLGYFISAFCDKLPADFSYAEYARKGFFELCAVSAINIGIVIVMNAVCKKSGKATSLTVYSGILTFFTLVLVTTAMSKMAMYISRFGLSRLRVYSSWFMILVMTVLLIIFIWGILLKKNIWRAVFAVFTVMLSIICFVDIDGYIAKYNIDGYKSGKYSKLDVSLFEELSDSAVRYIVTMKDDPDYGYEARSFLRDRLEKWEEDGENFGNWNLATLKAKKLCPKEPLPDFYAKQLNDYEFSRED